MRKREKRREIDRNREKKREKERKREKKREKMSRVKYYLELLFFFKSICQHLISIIINLHSIPKRKTKNIGRNARNFKKWQTLDV